MKTLLNALVVLLPWKLRRILLVKCYKYDIAPTARIGLSYIFPKHLVMKDGAHIGHLNVAIHLDYMELGEQAGIGRSNWITGFPTGTSSPHFAHQQDRRSELIVGAQSAITKNHHLDCTNTLRIGRFVTIAGYASQFLTHSIDVVEGRQSSRPIDIGDYCFVSTGVKVLGGAILPARSVLGAGAVLAKPYTDEWTLYAGVPARPVKTLSKEAKYFHRKQGFVY